MRTRVHTGGNMEFRYDSKNKGRDSTNDIDEKYVKKIVGSYGSGKLKKFIIPIILAFIIISLFIRWSNDGTFERFEAKLFEAKENMTSDFKEAGSEIKENIKAKTEEIKDSVKSKTLITGCPQINVPMDGNSIGGKTYDGWTVKGDATCRKGAKEGENLNKYYCGGYSIGFLGISEVNAYVEKTPISDEGDIGKTYKYVIWNIYDENQDFIETRCIGNPDEFERKQAEAFEREMLKWN